MASATALSLNAEAGPPEWIHLLPAGAVTTVDGRGPYRVADPARVIADSLQAAGGKLAIDENHVIDTALRNGAPAPARGWIVDMEARPDGIWGRVDWNESGKALLADRAYSGISPVLHHDTNNRVSRILRASLVNNPNLRGLTALHAEGADMDELLAALREKLGLPADADQAAIMAKIGELTAAPESEPAMQAALQAQLAPIAVAAGLAADARPADVVGKIKTLAVAGGGTPDAVAALQAELATVTTDLNVLRKGLSTERGAAFVDAAIKAGRVGVKPLRDHYIAMHAADPARVEKEINAMPILSASGALPTPPKADKDGKVALDAGQIALCAQLGLDRDAYAKTLAAEAAEQEIA